jgi:uncharacterized protein (TIGR02145 family)
VVYNDNATNTGTDKRLKLTATIKDCACCGAFTTSGTWLSFMCYNLGADSTLTTPDQIKNAPTSKTYGNLYQWGKRKGWPANGSLSGWSDSGNTNIDGPGYNTNKNAWGENGNKTDADPCPVGWRVPTLAQWLSILNPGKESAAYSTLTANSVKYEGGTTNIVKIGSALALPLGGWIISGQRQGYPNQADYWTATPAPNYPEFQLHSNDYLIRHDNQPMEGAFIRCVAD